MNTENETGVKVPKGQINYNTVAGSLGIAAFAGLGLRNWLGNGNGSVAAGAAAVAETQLVSGLMAELAKEKSERYADNVGINTFKEALAFDYANCNFVKYIKKINAAEICPVVELAARTAGPAVPDPNAPTTSTANA